MSSTIIEVKNYTKKYKDFCAVDNVSFEVKEGSIFAFLGPNGAGKSTTINTLCTIIDKTSGQLKIGGFDVSDQRDKVRSLIGVVFQDSTLDLKLTVEENLKMHCHFYNVDKTIVNERIDFVLDIVDLKKWKKSIVSGLSGGMKRRVEIARGLLHLPKVLILDEPTTGLDPQTRASIWEYVLKLQKERNMTIFLTTHYMDEAEICDSVAIMDHGKIIAHDTPAVLKQRYTKDIATFQVSSGDFQAALEENSFEYVQQENNCFQVVCSNIKQLLQFINENEKNIEDFEVKKGTLNDVFLTITGREMRD